MSVLRRNILLLYAITMIASCVAIGFYIHHGWIGMRDQAIDDLQKDTALSSQIISDGVKDAGKLLSITKFRIEEMQRNGVLDPKQFHQLLKESIENFTLYNENQNFGLLVYLDRDGNILAQNGIYPTPPYNLSDRLYFRLLKQDPDRKFSIGHLVKARTTGKLVFHMAMPLLDPEGKFEGTISEQISEDEIAATLEKITRTPSETVMGLLNTGEVAFLFPRPPDPDHLGNNSYPKLLHRITNLGKESGWIRILGGSTELRETVYVGYLIDPKDDVCTVATIRESEITSLFLSQYSTELLITLLLFLLISILFLGLHWQSRNLNEAISDSRQDPLTGIPNRRAAEEACTRIWGDAFRRQETLSVLFMDIDHFKLINDTYGHDAGDMMLKAVAHCIQKSLHRPLDFCCRWGGEEFVAILSDTSQEAALDIAETILDCVRKISLIHEGAPLPQVTISIGVATSTSDDWGNPQQMFSRADSAVLKAKREGRNRVVLD
jgi:diguanylate cyclase (GGDEF)-like protein